MRTRQVQNPRLSLVVAAGYGGIPCIISLVLLSEKSTPVTTFFVSFRHSLHYPMVRIRLSHIVYMCSTVVQHGGVCRSLVP